MVKNIILLFGITCLLLLGCSKPGKDDKGTGIASTDTTKAPAITVTKEFNGGTGYYTYAPSPIEYNNSRYLFVCRNETPFLVRDHIYLYKGTSGSIGYVWTQGAAVLAPSTSGWDDIHVCDPDVRKFTVNYSGKEYHWVMFYLGTDQEDNNHNQIGAAFAENIEGPYVKYNGNPIVTANTADWGVGQSTTIVLDSSSLLLCYSKGATTHTGLFARQLSFSKTGEFLAGEEKEVPFNGLTNMDGTKAAIIHDGSIAFSKNNIYLTVPVHPFEKYPDNIAPVSSSFQLAYKPIGGGLFDNDWKVLENIGQAQSGLPRNHNAAILTDEYGYLKYENSVTMYFTASDINESWLWSYGIYSMNFKL